MLFSNPRGVSCAKCHGTLGKGKFIAQFEDEDGKVQKFFGPDISKTSLETFREALDKGGALMPRYYLTNKEINAIYTYIKMVNSTNEPVELEPLVIEEKKDSKKEDIKKSNNKNNKEDSIISNMFNKIEIDSNQTGD
ncbi:MAG: cytochrome c [Epsilonproteobacteria bacterium]|nr:cytochrome c [Campylobacterota bacterium]